MANFYFRLRFHIPQHDYINCENEELEIPTQSGQPNLWLKGWDGDGTIQLARWLILSGGPYSSYDEAAAAGTKARHALMRYSIQSRVGIDLGKNRSTGGMSKYLKEKILSETGVQICDDVHGLFVYDGTQETRFASVGGVSLTLGHQVSEFLKLFQEANAAEFEPTEKQEVTFELFGASQRDSSPRSRFLTLVMAIEALLEPAEREPAAQDHVRSLIELTEESQLRKGEKASLISSLKRLLRDSIGRTGKLLAEGLLGGSTYDDKSPGSFFRHCYDLRSNLVHEGKIDDDKIELGTLVLELEGFVADLLYASLQPVMGQSESL